MYRWDFKLQLNMIIFDEILDTHFKVMCIYFGKIILIFKKISFCDNKIVWTNHQIFTYNLKTIIKSKKKN